MNNESLFDNNHLIVSYELLQLLRWMITTEPEAVKIIMHHAMQDGFMEQLTRARSAQEAQQSNEELQQTVIEFFDLLENELQDAAMHSSGEIHSAQKAFRPALEHVDSSLYDEDTLAVSVAHATSQLNAHTPQQAKEMLCKELLKNWRPRSHLLQ